MAEGPDAPGRRGPEHRVADLGIVDDGASGSEVVDLDRAKRERAPGPRVADLGAALRPDPAVPVADLSGAGAAEEPAPRQARLRLVRGDRTEPARPGDQSRQAGRHPSRSERPDGGSRPARRGGDRSGRQTTRVDDDVATTGDTGRAEPERPRRRTGPRQVDPDADPVAAAREICLRLLTDRARTRTELAQALRTRGVPGDAAATVLERFDEVGLIDDAAFAGQWVRSRQRSKGLARRAIAMELRRKGVADEVAGEALAEVDDESEARRARELVDRKLRSLTVDTPEQRTVAARRLVGMLARKGYGGGIAYGVVKEALAAHGADADELGTDPPID